ncbi:MAG TPA: c-type cytochrome [Terracidiphilus sp.]|nr:c-type cytochrome [Terracidiphilus sp.]
MKDGKGIRLVFLSPALVVGFLIFQHALRPIEAASQNNPQQPATAAPQDAGAAAYAQHCAICHGGQREGILPGFPPLLGIHHRMTDDKIADLIHIGKGRMPGFPDLEGGELTALLHFLSAAEPPAQLAPGGAQTSGLSAAGDGLFQQNCAFCHGRDAMGGETGPDLTQSRLVRTDRTGDAIAQVMREGRPDNKMPAFNFSPQEVRGIIAFIHAREAEAVARPGGRRGVAVADLQTGNVDAGKRYFEGTGGCAKCHSPSGDLAGIASRFEGLQLEERMLYPRDAKSTVTVKLASGQKISGVLAYLDEFTLALRDSTGAYRAWPTRQVQYTVKAPVQAHVELFGKYTDNDIHNLMAYLQTLR